MTRYLPRSDLGAVDTLVALSVVLVIVLRAGISIAFFRFYFDAEDEGGRRRVVRTSFWYTMAASTAGLIAGIALAEPLSQALFSTGSRADLVRAAFVLLWAYACFSHFLIVWSGNLSEETPWYLHRTAGGWQHLGRSRTSRPLWRTC